MPTGSPVTTNLAGRHARRVIDKGIERSPMRMAEARLTLGAVAAAKATLSTPPALEREALPRAAGQGTQPAVPPTSRPRTTSANHCEPCTHPE
ncbi:MAG: hypothetical protein QOH57_3808 [Mycobacterium sp.]|jgi:hypothetical protein|nr:hypothetical protein [Mycobacterium sp.]